jgi:arginase
MGCGGPSFCAKVAGGILADWRARHGVCVVRRLDDFRPKEMFRCRTPLKFPVPHPHYRSYGAQLTATRRIRVIGVPLDLGASRRGVDMGPSAVRVAGLEARLEALGHQVTDGGNIRVEIAETQTSGNENAHYLKQIAQTCTRTAEAVVKTLEEGMTPLVLGGDHSVAAGSVSGVAEFYRRKGEKIGVVWIDAHSDINTPETSPSGNVHGMPLAALLGLGPEALGNIFGYAPKMLAETRC